jgi:glycosyltransferase involved in cell wall biosynthesis
MDPGSHDKSVRLSIVIPHYNRKNLLIECLNSIAISNYPQENYEVLVVDDCSTCDTGDIQSFSRIRNFRFYRLGVNTGGASVPRNFGLYHARGDYILFIDSDDWISAEMLSRSMAIAVENDCDMVIIKKISERKAASNYQTIQGDVARIEIHSPSNEAGTDAFVFGDCYVIGRLMRRALIERCGIRFPENLKINEDVCFCRFFWAVAQTVGICASERYYLRPVGSDALSRLGMPREAAYNLMEYVFRNIMSQPEEVISWDKKLRIFSGRVATDHVQRLLDNSHYTWLLKENYAKYFSTIQQLPHLDDRSRAFTERVLSYRKPKK